MSAWGDSELLVELLDRQFKFLLDLEGTSQIIRLARVLSFLTTNPQLVGLLDDLRAEARTALEEYDAADRRIRKALGSLWVLHGPELRRRLALVRDGALDVHGAPDSFEIRLADVRLSEFDAEDDGIEQATKGLILSMGHWWKATVDIAERTNTPLEGEYAELGHQITQFGSVHAHAARKLGEASRALAWPAYERLRGNASATNPEPPELGDPGWIGFPLVTDFATMVRRADEEGTAYPDAREVRALYEEIAADARLLHEELRLRIGLARSRAALVQRYAARCEAFDADRLRELCEADPKNAERRLTLDFARYLFDAGLPPLIDATTGGLRPDVVHLAPSTLFYVEAKQYSDEHPRSGLRDAYKQVWSTWSRLRKTYPAPEAFLLVFRRSGPWVELPPIIRHEGLRLYSIVADISNEGGSREKSNPLRLTEEELRPKEQDS